MLRLTLSRPTHVWVSVKDSLFNLGEDYLIIILSSWDIFGPAERLSVHLDFELPVWQVAVDGVPLLHRHPLDGQNGFNQQHVRKGVANSLEAGSSTQSVNRRLVRVGKSLCA